MKRFMLTTAMCTGVAFAAAAQTADTAMPGDDAMTGMVPAFLASEFMGRTLYTLDSEDARAIGGGAEGLDTAERDSLRWTSSDTFIAQRDSWENVGTIDDIVMTRDGEIRGILLDVGGFLGFGAHSVMVELDQLYFVSDEGAAEGIDDFFVVIAMSQEQLEALPEFDTTRLHAGFEVGSDVQGAGVLPHEEDAAFGADGQTTDAPPAPGADQNVFGAADHMLAQEERTADRLIGADVFDATGESIGSVDDVVIGTDNGIDGIIVDVGGFLGIGAHTVKLPIDDAQIGWSDVDGDVRVQLSMTRERLEAMPEHEG